MTKMAIFFARLAAFESENSGWREEAEALNADRSGHDGNLQNAANVISRGLAGLLPRVEAFSDSHGDFADGIVSALNTAATATSDQIANCVTAADALFALLGPLPELQGEASKIPAKVKELEETLANHLRATEVAIEAVRDIFAKQCADSELVYQSALSSAKTATRTFQSALASSVETIGSQIDHAIPEACGLVRAAARSTITATSSLVVENVKGHAMLAVDAVQTDIIRAIDEAIDALGETIKEFVSGAQGGSGPVEQRARELITAIDDILHLIPQVVQAALIVPARVTARISTLGLIG